ncbi:RDD family protein [Afifella pfennigii]|uniref:RDD family protein n=1 Tax=Afifella pfennigii TaxID=209897 RepID=UPI00054DE4C6|nr:RDD family protein [Afifella pfennigii]
MSATTNDLIDAGGPPRLDPALHPELYDNVRTRRILAFLFDAVIMFVLMVVAFFVITVLGLFTLGLGFLLYALIWPVVPILYNMFTLGGANSATVGMRMMGLEMRTYDGGRMYSLLAAVHAALYWFSVTILTPFILLVSLFSARKRMLHDMAIGTTVIRADL